MARTAVRLPRPVGAVHRLPPRPVTYLRDCLLWLTVAVAAAGGLPLLDAGPVLTVAAVAGCLAAAGLTVAAGRRTQARRDLHDRLTEALAPVLEMPHPDRAAVRLARWHGRRPGHPTRIVLVYNARAVDTDPLWRSEITTICTRRLGSGYQVVKHQQRRCRLVLRAVPLPDEDATPHVQRRADRTITELLGPTATMGQPKWRESEFAGFTVTHQAGAKLAVAGYRNRVERIVSAMLPGRWRAHWDLERDTVRFELRPTLPTYLPHPSIHVDDTNRDRIPIAVSEDGEVVAWNLRGTGPHLLVVGKTGVGKTVALNGAVMECAARGWPVWILDPKRIEFMGLRDWPNVQIVATSIEDQVAVIYRAWEEMEHRYALIESGQAVESDFQPLILVLDEYRDFAGMVTDWYARIKVRGMPTKCPVFEKVSSIARKGRSARVHAILGVQRPDAEWLGGEMRDNFATRISLGRLSPQGAQMMWDQAWIGVSVPKGIPGRATAVSDDDRPLEVQAYWTPDPRRAIHEQHADDLQLLTDLLPTEEQHPKLAVQLAEELLNPLDDDGQPTGTPQTWDAVLTAQLVPSLEPPTALVEQLRVKTPLTPLQAKLAGAPAPTRPGPQSSAASPPPPALDPVDDVVDLGDGYAPEVTTTAARLQPGDLICTDDGEWVVVETAEHDVETGEFIVDWRSDVDDFGSITLPSDSPLRTRRPDLSEEDLP